MRSNSATETTCSGLEPASSKDYYPERSLSHLSFNSSDFQSTSSTDRRRTEKRKERKQKKQKKRHKPICYHLSEDIAYYWFHDKVNPTTEEKKTTIEHWLSCVNPYLKQGLFAEDPSQVENETVVENTELSKKSFLAFIASNTLFLLCGVGLGLLITRHNRLTPYAFHR